MLSSPMGNHLPFKSTYAKSTSSHSTSKPSATADKISSNPSPSAFQGVSNSKSSAFDINSSPDTGQVAGMVLALLTELIKNLQGNPKGSNSKSVRGNKAQFDLSSAPKKKTNKQGEPSKNIKNNTSQSTKSNNSTQNTGKGGKNEYLNFKQGQTGDCAVLSAIACVATDAKGKKLLDNNVKANGDGGYTVKLQGTGESFQVSKEQMADSKLSTGEPKVKALENAIKQHYEKKGDTFEGKGGPDVIITPVG
jgi:hypothetical protein